MSGRSRLGMLRRRQKSAEISRYTRYDGVSCHYCSELSAMLLDRKIDGEKWFVIVSKMDLHESSEIRGLSHTPGFVLIKNGHREWKRWPDEDLAPRMILHGARKANRDRGPRRGRDNNPV